METEEDDLQLEIPHEQFRVVDAASANWLVRRIVEARKYAERIEQWAAAELRRAEREQAFFVGRWGVELEEWARREIAQQHRRKSIVLPAGTVGFRSGPPKLVIVNEPALVAWCQDHLRSALRIHTAVLKSEITSYVMKTGEQPPGAKVDPGGRQSFFIR